jgi:hypothetical protein
MSMNVKQLIAELSKCPPDSDVVYLVDCGVTRSVALLSPEDSEGRVVLGQGTLARTAETKGE